VSAENAVTSRDLRILVEEAAEPVASENADVIVGDRGVGPKTRASTGSIRDCGSIRIGWPACMSASISGWSRSAQPSSIGISPHGTLWPRAVQYSDHCWPPPLRTHRSNLAAIAAGRGKEHTPASHGRNHRSACHLAYWTTRRLAFRHGLEQVEVLGVAAGKGGLLGELQLQLFPARDGVEFVGDVLQPGISRTGHCSTTAC
jgi:hypothetical protein